MGISNLKQNQSGRSMVEMLAVLAIMGLITLTFIIGYRYAMARHRSHVIISRLTEMATGASAQLILQDDFNLDEFKSSGDTYLLIQGAYPVMVEKNYGGKKNHFALSVSGISRMVCNFIVQYDWKLPMGKKVNDGVGCQDGEANTIMFVFDNDLVGGNQGIPASDPSNACPNISYETCQSRGYICACSESEDAQCTTVIMKSCTGTPIYHYTH